MLLVKPGLDRNLSGPTRNRVGKRQNCHRIAVARHQGKQERKDVQPTKIDFDGYVRVPDVAVQLDVQIVQQISGGAQQAKQQRKGIPAQIARVGILQWR